MNKKRILFLYNGGTIGQIPEIRNNVVVLVSPKDGNDFQKVCMPIFEQFKDCFVADFEVVTTKDSTNLTPKDWEKLIFRIKKAQDIENYDAVGIAHGTDTLAYTSTALALALHGSDPTKSGLRIPICLTGAQKPIYDEMGDGRSNLGRLLDTLKQALEHDIADVLVNFNDRILLGCRILKASEKKFDAMKSPAFPDVGEVDANGTHLFLQYLHKKKDAKEKMMLAPKFGRGVISLELSPGLEPNMLLGFIINGGVQAMILKSLGEGNICCEGEYSLDPAIKQATEEYMTPIFITTKFIGGSSGACHYETGLAAINAGGISCYDHTDVAVDVKVRWLIGNGICSTIDEFRKAMATSYAGEVTQTPLCNEPVRVK